MQIVFNSPQQEVTDYMRHCILCCYMIIFIAQLSATRSWPTYSTQLSPMSGVPNMNTSNTQQLDEHILWDISEFLSGEKWVKVGRQLRVTCSVLTTIERNSSNDYRECAYKMLTAWQDEKPHGTLQDLFTALMKLKWELPIRKIKEHFIDARGFQSHPASTEIRKIKLRWSRNYKNYLKSCSLLYS